MRLIKTFSNGQQAQKFSLFLDKRKIANNLDMEMDPVTSEFSYSLWVHNEDQIPEATELLRLFEKNPDDSKYPLPSVSSDEDPIRPMIPHTKKYPFFWTIIILALCVGSFIVQGVQATKMISSGVPANLVVTPLMNWALFDEPTMEIALEKIEAQYPAEKVQQNPLLKMQKQKAYNVLFQKQHFWIGIYPILVNNILNPKEKIAYTAPPFTKIAQGEVWRLVTPIFLHGGLLHILFNMLWLWFLGKQVEPRLSSFRYLLLVIILAATTNVAQYLMSGPLFLGYSGVIMGMVGFIWSRQRVAPWEGYPMEKVVFLFIGIYLAGLFVLELISFLALLGGKEFLFGLQIANTAHVTGAIAGLILGRLSFFRWRSHE